MPTLKVYNGEFFQRGRWWYVGFIAIILAIVLLSLFYKAGESIHTIIGVIILLMIVGGYFFVTAKTNMEIELVLKPEGIQVAEKLIPFALLKGFVLEIEKKSGSLKNIVFVFEKTVEIYTLKDTDEQQNSFFAQLSKIIPFLETYEQGMVEKLMRKLKL